ncbi:uncharacterized protein ACA1_309790 [Acanthamoeba castellanii str. Neff]|uniref:Uncharacterized protein n=1 Tax=Acanthamoeba castellanii (strain ATCC 30010 / Neff) TaxID=1257118 RepID=L8HH85_ACACF|nr:uncharacterized protein ACA1_309790 [Acanthamoeba castellanii str. Neff]ELR24944.1 hypothetical protein ACA1_309790 [Acanthamoeba castellanii str. Neff]
MTGLIQMRTRRKERLRKALRPSATGENSTIYFKGVDINQVNDVLDDLKGIDTHYEVSQVMHNRFTKTMSVVLMATDTDRVTKAHQLVEQCYSGPGKFSPEHAFDEKEVDQAAMAIHTVKQEGNHIISNKDFVKAVKELCHKKEVLSTLINKGGATINFNNYFFQPWHNFSLKPIIINIKPVPPQVKPSKLRALVHKLCRVHLVDTEFICCDNTYQSFVKGTVAMEQDLVTMLEHMNVELFIGCLSVQFRRQMSQEEFKKTREKCDKSQANAANFQANKAAQDAARKIEQAKQARAIKQQEARAREATTAMQHRIQEHMAQATFHQQDP